MKLKSFEMMRKLTPLLVLILLPRLVDSQVCTPGGGPNHCSEICLAFQELKPRNTGPQCIELEVFSILPGDAPGTIPFKFGTYLGIVISVKSSDPACQPTSPTSPFLTSGRPTSYRLGALDEDGFPIGDFAPCSGLSKDCNSELCDYANRGDLYDNSLTTGITARYTCPRNACFKSKVYDLASFYTPEFLDIQEQAFVPGMYEGLQVVWRPGPIKTLMTPKIKIKFVLEYVTGTAPTETISSVVTGSVVYRIPDSITNPTTYPAGVIVGQTECHPPVSPTTFDPTTNPSIEGFPTLPPSCCALDPMYKDCPPPPTPPPPTPPPPTPPPPTPPPPITQKPIVVVPPVPPTPAPPRVITPAPPVKSKVEEFYEECNGKGGDQPPSKRCIPGIFYPRPPNDQTFREESCVKGSSCEIVLGYGKEDKGDDKQEDEVILELLGQSRFWAAVGFSQSDREMGNDLVIECVSDNNQPVALFASWNFINDKAEKPFDRKRNKRIVDPDFVAKNKKTVRLIESKLENSGNKDYIYCRFAIKKIIRYSFMSPITHVSESYEFNLHQNPGFLIYALGVFRSSKDSFGEGGNLNYHGAKRYFTNNKTTLGLKFFPNEAQQELMKAHGHVMFLVWMVLLPIGGFIGRYYKETFRKYSICGVKLWLLTHILFTGTAMFLIFVGYFLLSKSKADWQFVGGVQGNPHLYTGITCSSLTFCSMYGGIFMSERNPKDKWHVIEIVHGLTGHAAFLSGFLTIYNSGDVLFSNMPCEMYYILWPWIILYFIFHIIMSYHYCWVDWVDGRLGRSWWCFNFTVVFQPYDSTALEDAPGAKIRIWILIAFIVFSLIVYFSAAILLSVTLSEMSCLSLKEYNVFRE